MDPDLDPEMLKPYTERNNFNYLLNFLKGSTLDQYYEFTDECTYSYVYTRDDWFFFNRLRQLEEIDNTTGIPEFTRPSFANKTLNFTALIGANFADSLPNCY